MTIVASGEISLGGNATATRSVACELARSGTAQICMNESAVRTLAGVPSGQISMSNFYGKSNVPTTFGQFCYGGYYTGTISSPANYFLIVAPNATGCACCQWMWPTTHLTGNCSNPTCNNNNGYWNTYTYLNTQFYPAGNWTATRSIGGFSDWYLPAKNELNVLYTNKGSMPAGECYAEMYYWSSTEYSFNTAYVQIMGGPGSSATWRKGGTDPYSYAPIGKYGVRAVRRVSF